MILVTGSSGFVGRYICEQLDKLNQPTLPLVRTKSKCIPSSGNTVRAINGQTDYTKILNGIEVVLHIAGRAHVLNESNDNPLSEFRKVNTEGTLNLANQAALSGIKRFIFISSMAVYGLSSSEPFIEADKEAPYDPFSLSKYEAEIGLREIAKSTGMEVTIIRPPLIYGWDAPGNFGRLIRLLEKPLPLPFGLVSNKRSMIYIDNLVNFIIHCIDHPRAVNQTFVISDGQDVSLNSLVRMVRRSWGKPVLLVPIPVNWFKIIGKLLGKTALIERLVGNFQVDSSKARKLLGWEAPYSVEEGIAQTVKKFRNRRG